ncbi:MFS family permease [Mycolicibacterium sp. BK556]|uniref:MFS transporter n=1 Tax=unclassified Mycolicibacterium TaxID=2636767 RepID=UPI00160A3542|nr:MULTISPECIES: MFS transporter [unclassified Mycolicibacterium]MBB3605373.1 MFS family permease [Mycolicibacterium sp. BK556]MBB3635569.1 MFS family permease [Mycolicibacterium sp. BK607]
METLQAGRARAGRVALASYVGSAIEYYDFFIYGTAAALVFPIVFFPHLSPLMATIASLGTFAAAFLSRPLGAAVFGHFGDRIGRKNVLVFTLVIMGACSIGVGLIPSTDTIGIAAPLLLISMRLLQGFAVGGEWAGAALMSAEHAPQGRRGYFCMFTQLGLGTALVLGNLVFLGVHGAFGEAESAFFQWGWRIPFLLSAVLLAVAMYIRLHVEESSVFAESAGDGPAGVPIAQAMRHQGREMVLAAGAVMGLFMLAFQVGTYFPNYAATHLHYDEDLILLVGVAGGLCSLVFVAASAMLSDTYGRRRILAVGGALALPWTLILFPMIQSGDPVRYGLAIIGTYAIIGIMMGPLAAFIPETFATRYRYSGAGFSYNIGGILGGALPPVLSPMLVSSYGTGAVTAMMTGFAVVSLVSVLLLSETAGRGMVRQLREAGINPSTASLVS